VYGCQRTDASRVIVGAGKYVETTKFSVVRDLTIEGENIFSTSLTTNFGSFNLFDIGTSSITLNVKTFTIFFADRSSVYYTFYLHAGNSSLLFTNCYFSLNSNASNCNGSQIYSNVSGNKIFISRSLIGGVNNAKSSPIILENINDFTLINSSILNCSSKEYGGVIFGFKISNIHIEEVTVRYSRCLVQTKLSDGGAFRFLYFTSASFKNCSFVCCISTHFGGCAILGYSFADECTVTVDSCSFIDSVGSSSYGSGGLAFANGNQTSTFYCNISNSTFYNCTSGRSGSGGALCYLSIQNVSINNCSFINCLSGSGLLLTIFIVCIFSYFS
jgi:hypothetical protein